MLLAVPTLHCTWAWLFSMTCLMFLWLWDVPLGSCFQAKVTIRLQWSPTDLCSTRACQRVLCPSGCGVRIYWWAWSRQAAAHSWAYSPSLFHFYNTCRARRDAVGILAVYQSVVKQGKNIYERDRSVRPFLYSSATSSVWKWVQGYFIIIFVIFLCTFLEL